MNIAFQNYEGDGPIMAAHRFTLRASSLGAHKRADHWFACWEFPGGGVAGAIHVDDLPAAADDIDESLWLPSGHVIHADPAALSEVRRAATWIRQSTFPEVHETAERLFDALNPARAPGGYLAS